MLRRGLALGGGLIVLILIVLGVKGCLDARANRELSDYARNVTQIVEETEQTSKAFFGKLEDPGSLSVTEFIDEVNADRSAMDNYASRVDGLGAPGDMGNAQNTLELVYELRGSAMNEIAKKMSTALADAGVGQSDGGDRQPDAEAAGRRRPLRTRSCGRKSTASSPTTGSSGSDVPESTFLPDGTKWLEESAVADALGAISGETGDDERRACTASNSSAPASTAPNSAKATTAVVAAKKRSKSKSRSKTRVNRPRTASAFGLGRWRRHSAGLDRSIEAGEIGTVTIPLTPTPSGEVTLEVKVEPVPGEQVTENNEASYTVTFE